MSNNVTTGYRTSLPELRFKCNNVLNLSVKFIIFYCFLNIEWYVLTTTGWLGNVLLIVPMGLLLCFYWSYAICNRFILASVGPIWIYVLIAIIYGIPTEANNFLLAIVYIVNSVLIAIIAIYIIKVKKEAVDDIVRFSRNILLILQVSIILTPYVSFFLDSSFSVRFTGLFRNPNEASLASVLFLNLIFYCPFNKQTLNYFLIILSAVNVALTFSKTGIILFVFSLMLFLWFKRKLFFWMALLVLVVSASQLEQIFIFFQNNLASHSQIARLDLMKSFFWTPGLLGNIWIARRLDLMKSFFLGRFDSETTGYKNVIWPRAYLIIRDNFPHGFGLGEFYRLYGYVYVWEDHTGWQGVHNMYLMIAGEAGFFVFALFVGCYGSLLVFAFFYSKDRLPFAIISNILIFAMSSHNNLEQEYQVVLFAIAIGLLGKKTESHLRSP